MNNNIKDPTEIWNKYMQEEFSEYEVDKLSDMNYQRMVMMLAEYDNILYIIRNKYVSCRHFSSDDMCRFIERVYRKFNEKVFHGYLNLESLEIIRSEVKGKNVDYFAYRILLDGEVVSDNDFRLYLIHKFEKICFMHKLRRILE